MDLFAPIPLKGSRQCSGDTMAPKVTSHTKRKDATTKNPCLCLCLHDHATDQFLQLY